MKNLIAKIDSRVSPNVVRTLVPAVRTPFEKAVFTL
jgi:hypothetical protein